MPGMSPVWLVLEAIGCEVNGVLPRGHQSNDRLGGNRFIPHLRHWGPPSSPSGSHSDPKAQG
jgi:hypothetical protein